MNRVVLIVGLLLGAAHCKSTSEATLNFDRDARVLQEKINDTNYTFYHEKHPAQLEVPLKLPADFRSERELRSGVFIYRLEIEETGAFSFRAVKPAPDYFEPHLAALLKTLKFKPAWIGPRNLKSEFEIHFRVEYEAH